MAQRLAFLEQAERRGAWVVEDDFDSEFRYSGRPIPALSALDRYGRTLYLGSFSKTLSPTLKLSYLVIPPGLVERFAATIATVGTKASLPPQRPLAAFIEEGSFHRHIRKMRRTYGARRQALLRHLRDSLGARAQISDFPAGMHLVLHLVDQVDDLQLSRAALQKGVVLPPLSFYFAGPARLRGLVFGFSSVAEEDMAEPLSAVVELLSRAISIEGRCKP